MSTGLLARAFSPFQTLGFLAGSAYVIDRLLGSLSNQTRFRLYEFMAQPVPDEPLLKGRRANSITMREIAEGDPCIESMPPPAQMIRERFEQGAICLGAYQKETWIGYIWLCFDRYEEDEVRCTYLLDGPGHAVFDFDLYIFPEYRLGLGFVGIWHGTNQFLEERGIRYTFSRVSRYNLASRKSHAHLGAVCIGRGAFLKLWQVEFMFATISPYIGLNIRKCGRTTLKLCAPT